MREKFLYARSDEMGVQKGEKGAKGTPGEEQKHENTVLLFLGMYEEI